MYLLAMGEGFRDLARANPQIMDDAKDLLGRIISDQDTKKFIREEATSTLEFLEVPERPSTQVA